MERPEDPEFCSGGKKKKGKARPPRDEKGGPFGDTGNSASRMITSSHLDPNVMGEGGTEKSK